MDSRRLGQPARRYGASPIDYDGDGKADLTIVRIEEGNLSWSIRQSSDDAQINLPFGLPGDIPAP